MVSNDLAVTNAKAYMAQKKKELDDALEKIAIDDQTLTDIAVTNAAKGARDGIIEALPFGKIVTTILQWNDNVDDEVREAKKEYLLQQLRAKCADSAEAIARLRALVENPQGNTLFNKILRILDDSPPDPELSNHLSSALKFITDTDFESLFSDHKFALAQIERLSPQALSLLSNHTLWPDFSMAFLTTTSDIVTSNWTSDFSSAFASRMRATQVVDRINHSASELENGGYVEARNISEKGNMVRANPTDIGRLLLPYLAS